MTRPDVHRWSAAKYDLMYSGASAAIICGGSYALSLLSEGTFPYILSIMTLFSCSIILMDVRAIGMGHAALRLIIVALLSGGFVAMIQVIPT